MEKDDRTPKLEELIRRNAAEFFERESNRDALVSVTRAVLSPDTKQATIYLSVLPNTKEKAVLDFAKRLRGELRSYLKDHVRTRVIPFVEVEIDMGEKNRQRADDLLR
jgi:ribosome-binding factor A